MRLGLLARIATAAFLSSPTLPGYVKPKERKESTLFDTEDCLLGVVEHWHVISLFYTDQIARSSIIVRGKAIDIMESVETKDILEKRCPYSKYFHTDVIFEVSEYLGPVKLPYDHLVIRHYGGRVDDIGHLVTNQEHLNLDEEVVIFRLYQRDEVTQIPEGFVREQYYIFNAGSKFIYDGCACIADFPGPSVTLQAIKDAFNHVQPRG